MMDKLLPCPFCGGEVQIDMLDSENSRNVKIYSAVHCPKCHEWFFKGLSKEKTVAAWNRRTGRDINVATNADRIRSMSDKELHKFLLDFEAGDIDYAKTFCDLCCKDAALERKSTDCEGCLLWWLKNDATLPQGIDWLRQPVKEEHNEDD